MTELDRIFDHAWRQTISRDAEGVMGMVILESARKYLQTGGGSDVSTVAAYLTVKALRGAGWIVEMPKPIPEGNR